MSIHSAFHIEKPRQLSPLFLLGLDHAGQWVIREENGRRAGIFGSREAAIRFARDESAGGNFTILQQPDGLELEPGGLGHAA